MQTDWTDNFEKLYNQRGQHKYGIRLLALWKIQDGMSQTDLCELIGRSHKTIRLWRKSYESNGLEGLLKIQEGRGRKPRIIPIIRNKGCFGMGYLRSISTLKNRTYPKISKVFLRADREPKSTDPKRYLFLMIGISEKSLIDDAISKLSADNKGGRICGQDLVDYFSSQQDIHYSLSGMYHRLHKLKYSWITSRSKHPKQTSEAIEEFKKKVPNSCQKSHT